MVEVRVNETRCACQTCIEAQVELLQAQIFLAGLAQDPPERLETCIKLIDSMRITTERQRLIVLAALETALKDPRVYAVRQSALYCQENHRVEKECNVQKSSGKSIDSVRDAEPMHSLFSS